MTAAKPSLSIISTNLLVYGTTHAMIDCVSAAVIFSIGRQQFFSAAVFTALVFLYNVLAFALQPLFGLLADHFRIPRVCAVLGCLLTGLAAVNYQIWPAAIVLIGLGNALYHIGGGSISLNLTPGKAAAPGIYVAPGALGLFVGVLLGTRGLFVGWVGVLILVALAVAILVIRKPHVNYATRPAAEPIPTSAFALILLLVMLSITIRAAVGVSLVFPWKNSVEIALVVTLAIVAGKALGGILGDRFGWMRIGVGALLLSLPLLVWGAGDALLAISGMFLFNITMPITLVVIANILPGRPGFAFGLTCLALMLGTLPVWVPLPAALPQDWFVLGAISVSALALYFGLKLYSATTVDRPSVSISLQASESAD